MSDTINIGACMTGKAVGERAEREFTEKGAELLRKRRSRRGRKQVHFVVSWFRGFRTIREI